MWSVCGCLCVRSCDIFHKSQPLCPCSSNTYHGNQCRGQVKHSYPTSENTTADNKCGRLIHTSTAQAFPPYWLTTDNVCVPMRMRTPTEIQMSQWVCVHSSCRRLSRVWPGDIVRAWDELSLPAGSLHTVWRDDCDVIMCVFHLVNNSFKINDILKRIQSLSILQSIVCLGF